MKSIAKFIAICSKFSDNGRDYSSVIRFIQSDGRQVYTYSDGFFAVCMTARCNDMEIVSPMMIPMGCCSMSPSSYPDVFGAVGYDMSSVTNPTDDQISNGAKIKALLDVTKVSATTSINPETLVISHDKNIPCGSTLAKPLAEFCKIGALTYYGLAKDDIAKFGVSTGGFYITIACAITPKTL